MSEIVTVGPMDPSQKNSPMAGPVEEESTVMLNAASRVCYWNGQEFIDGQYVSSESTKYECSFGHWVKQD